MTDIWVSSSIMAVFRKDASEPETDSEDFVEEERIADDADPSDDI